MGKRVRPKGGVKGARWAKGQSCVSNPTKNKHRAKAKPMFGQQFSPHNPNTGIGFFYSLG